MNRYEFIQKSLNTRKPETAPIPVVAVPSMSLTPKEILERFTSSQDVMLHENHQTDSVVDNFTDQQFDDADYQPEDDVIYSDDKFELMENVMAVNNDKYYKRKKGEKKNENDTDNSNNNASDTVTDDVNNDA